MEVYYRGLISQETSLEKLVDDLMRVVQGANEFAEAAGANVPATKHAEIRHRLEQLKEGCRRVKQQAIASALATDKLLHQYPYSSIGFAFAAGVLAGVLGKRR
jgi:ElaB/YqjD/DUF883 family membrane-anchored ribosome-binding protein